jgi:hypothetical protein
MSTRAKLNVFERLLMVAGHQPRLDHPPWIPFDRGTIVEWSGQLVPGLEDSPGRQARMSISDARRRRRGIVTAIDWGEREADVVTRWHSDPRKCLTVYGIPLEDLTAVSVSEQHRISRGAWASAGTASAVRVPRCDEHANWVRPRIRKTPSTVKWVAEMEAILRRYASESDERIREILQRRMVALDYLLEQRWARP